MINIKEEANTQEETVLNGIESVEIMWITYPLDMFYLFTSAIFLME